MLHGIYVLSTSVWFIDHEEGVNHEEGVISFHIYMCRCDNLNSICVLSYLCKSGKSVGVNDGESISYLGHSASVENSQHVNKKNVYCMTPAHHQSLMMLIHSKNCKSNVKNQETIFLPISRF